MIKNYVRYLDVPPNTLYDELMDKENIQNEEIIPIKNLYKFWKDKKVKEVLSEDKETFFD